MTWTGAEGQKIEGLLTYPVGYEGGQVLLVLDVHGGPAAVHDREFTGEPSIYMYQVFAQEGYAVLRPNPRGSTGYGLEFRGAVVEDWGYGDYYEDLMSGVDWVIDMDVAHPDSLAIVGWSYGGYMTSWAATQTDCFKAASMGAGMSNLISMVGTMLPSGGPEAIADYMGGELWERYEAYAQRSPIYHVKIGGHACPSAPRRRRWLRAPVTGARILPGLEVTRRPGRDGDLPASSPRPPRAEANHGRYPSHFRLVRRAPQALLARSPGAASAGK